MKRNKIITLLFGLVLIITVVLPACSSGTTVSTTPVSTSKPITPADTGPVTLKLIDASPTSTEIHIARTMQIDVIARYSNNSIKNVTEKCTFKSNDEKVATVSTSGLITAVADGACEIIVSYTENGATQTDSVSVSTTSAFLATE
jgi:uncharacterized protein YjdB